jgi:NADPH:quinone reductase-like Zn-dependent oxidoreductase
MAAVVVPLVQHEEVFGYLDRVFGENLHLKRIESLSNGTLGVMTGASLAVCMIGQALAQARGLATKHATKQVDRLLSNMAIDVWDLFAQWVPEVIGGARDITVVLDWTDFDADDQATPC